MPRLKGLMTPLCPRPFNHLHINNGGYVTACCKVTPQYRDPQDPEGMRTSNVIRYGVKKAFRSSAMQQMREQFLNQQWSRKCQGCKIEEDMGVTSGRQVLPQEEIFVDGLKITSMDLRLGNSCNLKCRMCWPLSSEALLEEWSNSPQVKMKTLANHMKNLDFINWSEQPGIWQEIVELSDDVHTINFAGGEPFLNKQHAEFLLNSKLAKRGSDITLTYNSNLSVIPPWLETLAKTYKKVMVFVSIDAFGELNDFIRHPLKWSVLVKHLERLNELAATYPQLQIHLQTTVQAYNVLYLDQLFDFLMKSPWQHVPKVPAILFVHQPEFFNVSALPKELRQKAANRLADFAMRSEMSGYWKAKLDRIVKEIQSVLHADSAETRYQDFLKINEFFDQARGQDYFKIAPEMKNYSSFTSPGAGSNSTKHSRQN